MLYINYLIFPFSKSLDFSIYFPYFYISIITSYNTSGNSNLNTSTMVTVFPNSDKI